MFYDQLSLMDMWISASYHNIYFRAIGWVETECICVYLGCVYVGEIDWTKTASGTHGIFRAKQLNFIMNSRQSSYR